MNISLLILVVIAILLGALVRNIFGFGEALVTMPLLSLLNIDFKLSVSIVAIIGILVTFPVFIKSRKDIDWSIIKRLLIGSIIGAPIGIFIVNWTDEAVIVKCLGIFILVYGLVNLINQFVKVYQMNKKIPNQFDYIAGTIAGLLGSAYNSHGVPIVIYGTLKKWDIFDLKKISQVHFFITGCFIVTSHGVSGFWSPSLWYLLIIVIPLLVLTLLFGNMISKRIDPKSFIKYVYILLIVFGILMIFK
ncbi:sulfite exporter TauE/SafE family protein [Mammaliicoccus lentus]|jgi:uncharacterized membrane protein YfcA|uniref:sulfite exporter TauE/SafE family protein n=1 Tax=Mammaliicoccus lentus TaxID=42858 RepID=UPI003515BF5E